MGTYGCAAALLLLPALGLHAAEGAGAGMNRFGIGLYQALARGSDNLVVSPLSNYSALCMLLEGARGQTAAQLARVLSTANSGGSLSAALAAVLDPLAGRGNMEGSELLTAQGLWIQRGFPIRTDYERALVQYYHAAVTQYDFARNPEEARVAINFWTANQTKGKIQELFAPGTLGNSTRMIVTSAIYYHGLWQLPFAYEDTRPQSFHVSARETVRTDTMSRTGTFAYAEAPGLQVLEMKYGKSPIVFDVLLPKTAEGLGALEASLTPEKLASLWSGLNSRPVAVSLPRFRVAADLSLRESLGGMGVRDAFSGAADFSGIDDRRDLVLADLKHKAFLEVGEEGTIAAAVSGGDVRLIATSPQPVTFRADHPFLFLVRDTHSGIILFLGRLARPKW